MAGLELHEEVQQDAEQDHRDDDQSADPVSQRERNRAGHQKDDDERIAEEADEAKASRVVPCAPAWERERAGRRGLRARRPAANEAYILGFCSSVFASGAWPAFIIGHSIAPFAPCMCT